MLNIPKDENCKMEELKKMKGVARSRHGGVSRSAIDHDFLVTTIKQAILKRGYGITDTQCVVSNDQCTISGFIEIHGKNAFPESGNHTVCIGFMNSNAGNRRGSTSLRLCIGGRDGEENGFVYDGFTVIGKDQFSRETVESYLKVERGIIHGMHVLLEKSFTTPLDRVLKIHHEKTVGDILVTLGHNKVLPWNKVGDLYEVYMSNTIEDYMDFDFRMEFGKIVGTLPPLKQLEKLCAFSEIYQWLF